MAEGFCTGNPLCAVAGRLLLSGRDGEAELAGEFCEGDPESAPILRPSFCGRTESFSMSLAKDKRRLGSYDEETDERRLKAEKEYSALDVIEVKERKKGDRDVKVNITLDYLFYYYMYSTVCYRKGVCSDSVRFRSDVYILKHKRFKSWRAKYILLYSMFW